MKKVVYILTLILILMMLSACSFSMSTDENISVNDEKSSGITTKSSSTKVSSDNTKATESAKATTTAEADVSVNEQIILDQDDIIISLKSLSHSSFAGPSLKVQIENNSKKDVTIQTRNSAINGIMVDTMFSCDIASGKKANDEITFMTSDLESAGVEIISEIEFVFHVFDSDTWDGIFDSATINIKTSAFDTHVQSYDDSGFVALEHDDIKIVIKKLDNDSFWGADIIVYIENNSDKNITVQLDETSINGFMIDPIFSCEILSGKKAFDSITFLESDLKENDIDNIEELELRFNIFNTDTWDDIFDSDIVKISFKE